MNFFPQEVYLKMNKFRGIHNLKFCLKKSCPGDDGTILERMSLKTFAIIAFLHMNKNWHWWEIPSDSQINVL